ncbi:hypothetical protein QBC38DRAFT_263148 [Podospora fimiseda]|uniref:CSI2 protein n=1 Tax=Podospora fimiseda TaxID=252190 RepID=A0AAN7BLJ4_9PEZI|nr:hypothetical protein QBC38DRAFT_263148 [Podospora fimiseda]
MRSSTFSLKRALLLSVFLAANALAQDDDNTARPPATTNNRPPAATTPAPAPQQTTTQNRPNTSNNPPPPQTKEEEKDTSVDPAPTGTPPPLGQGTTTEAPQPSDFTKVTGLPTLSKTVDNFIPEYPPPTIPPTRNAPFMNHSTLPDGTVFIAVGAILGAFGLAILAWRAIVVCLLHRSVERAAHAQHAATDKSAASFPAPPAHFYKYAERESNASLALGGAGAGAAGVGVRRTHRGPTPSATPSQTNLFFSPTAAGSSVAIGGANRDSRFLPSGFYAAASQNPGGHAHGHGNSISMSTLRPSSRGRAGHMGPSPPDSPGFGPSNGSPGMGVGMSRGNFSSSSLNLPRPASAGQGANGGRAPSAYLDDLLDDQPGLFPPAGMTPGQGGQHQQGPYNGGRNSPGSPLGRRY